MPFFSSPTRLRPLSLGLVALGLLVLVATGCVRLLEPRASDATYYLLDGPQPPSPQSTDTTGVALGMRQPRMASYLDATRIVTRRGPNQIEFAEFHRWGEDLSQGISRTLALALESQNNVRSVQEVPWPKGTAFDYLLRLHVLAFEGVGPPSPGPDDAEEVPAPEGHSRMVVQWALLNPADDSVLARGLTRHEIDGWRVTNYKALATNLGTSLGVLAEDIATRLDTLNRP